MNKNLVLAVMLGAAMLADLGQGKADAQTDSEVNASIQFNFLKPGARSLGMGGAFVGLADDATAAFTNAAGLNFIEIKRPQVSFEGRVFGFSHLFLYGGSTFNRVPTGQGVDFIDGLVMGEAKDSTMGLSFLSFIYPEDRWSVAVYRREAANFRASGIQTQGAFICESELGELCDEKGERLFPYVAGLDLDIVDVGFSAAFRHGRYFSTGVGISIYDFSMRSRTERFAVGGGLDTNRPDFSPEKLVNVQIQTGDDTDVAVNLGFVWRFGDGRWSVGGVYREGPDFKLTVSSEAAGTGAAFKATTDFHVPDVLGFGAALRPSDAIRVSLDYDRVRYSQLTDGFVPLFGEQSGDPRQYRIDDANEFHLGFEYFRKPVALRVGLWTDPDHRLRYDGKGGQYDITNRALFQPGKDEIHYTGGLGFVIGSRFQIDMALDYSPRIVIGSLSMVMLF